MHSAAASWTSRCRIYRRNLQSIHTHRRMRCCAQTSSFGGNDPGDLDAQRDILNRMMGLSSSTDRATATSPSITGEPSNASLGEMLQQPFLVQKSERNAALVKTTCRDAMQELRSLIYDKWGKSYDVRLIQRNGKMFLHIMWKFLEQKSFALTAAQYQEQLDAIADLCTIWGVGDTVRAGIRGALRPPHVHVGTGKAVQIHLGDNLSMMAT